METRVPPNGEGWNRRVLLPDFELHNTAPFIELPCCTLAITTWGAVCSTVHWP